MRPVVSKNTNELKTCHSKSLSAGTSAHGHRDLGRGCVPRSVEKERRSPLRHQGIRSGGNLRVFENLAQTLVAVDAP